MATMYSKFTFGDIVKHKITNVKGVVMGVYFYHTGCTHYGVQPLPKKKGEVAKDGWVNDEESLWEATGKTIQKSAAEPKGGPHQQPDIKEYQT